MTVQKFGSYNATFEGEHLKAVQAFGLSQATLAQLLETFGAEIVTALLDSLVGRMKAGGVLDDLGLTSLRGVLVALLGQLKPKIEAEVVALVDQLITRLVDGPTGIPNPSPPQA